MFIYFNTILYNMSMIELQKEIIEKLYIKEGKSKIEVASTLVV